MDRSIKVAKGQNRVKRGREEGREYQNRGRTSWDVEGKRRIRKLRHQGAGNLEGTKEEGAGMCTGEQQRLLSRLDFKWRQFGKRASQQQATDND